MVSQSSSSVGVWGPGIIAVLLAACAPPLAGDAMLARARMNEIAAVHEAKGRMVQVGGVIRDLGFYGENQLETTASFGRHSAQAVTKGTTRSVPVAVMTAADGSTVMCFLSYEASENAWGFEKGKDVVMLGKFWAFGKDSRGNLELWLQSCDRPDGPTLR